MSFTAYWFLFALGVVFVVYYMVPRRFRWMFLLVSGYLLYATAGWLCLVYISVTTFSTYLMARIIANMATKRDEYIKNNQEGLSREERKSFKAAVALRQRVGISIALILNIGLMVILKYAPFDLMVPLGLSFYTFQSIGYLMDVYYEKCAVQTNYFKFALFVGFFPQLSQGPISRYSDLSKTLYNGNEYDGKRVAMGLQRMLWGYFKKLVIADRVLIGLATMLEEPADYKGTYFLVAIVFYGLQLYADFTGGIDITIGIAEVFGIKIKENFCRPYFSKSIKEYWNRWHISMGSWFTDYVFYPISVSKVMRKLSRWSRKYLGDNVGKRIPVYLSTIIVWTLTGIWHGAGWNFVVWGLANCIVILISQEMIPLYRRFHARFKVADRMWYKAFSVLRTLLLMGTLRMFDCYSNVAVTFAMFASLFTNFNIQVLWNGSLLSLGLTAVDYVILALGVGLMVTVSLLQRKESVRARIERFPYLVRAVVWFGLFLVVLLMGVYGQGYDAGEFIYNRF